MFLKAKLTGDRSSTAQFEFPREIKIANIHIGIVLFDKVLSTLSFLIS